MIGADVPWWWVLVSPLAAGAAWFVVWAILVSVEEREKDDGVDTWRDRVAHRVRIMWERISPIKRAQPEKDDEQ